MKNTDIVLNHKLFNKKINKIEDDEKTRVFCKHDFSHLMDVARICYIINLEENLNIDKDLIYVTALLHDLGRADEVDTGINHSILSQEIAQELSEAEHIVFICGHYEGYDERIRTHLVTDDI